MQARSAENRPSVEGVFAHERTDAIGEPANHRGFDPSWIAAIESPYRPSPSVKVERPQRYRPTCVVGQLKNVVIDVASPVEDLPGDARTLEFLPLVVSRQSSLETPVVDVPRSLYLPAIAAQMGYVPSATARAPASGGAKS
jgi:hypothetical protein